MAKGLVGGGFGCALATLTQGGTAWYAEPKSKGYRQYLSDTPSHEALLTMGHDVAAAAVTRHVLPLLSAPQHTTASTPYHSPLQFSASQQQSMPDVP